MFEEFWGNDANLFEELYDDDANTAMYPENPDGSTEEDE